jgi:hypothetical protein
VEAPASSDAAATGCAASRTSSQTAQARALCTVGGQLTAAHPKKTNRRIGDERMK